MDISISVSFMDKCLSIMAIPIYVPEGIGPIVDNNNNHTNTSTTTNNHSYNVSNNNSVPNNNNTTSPGLVNYQLHLANSIAAASAAAASPPRAPADVSFTHQLISELYYFYIQYIMGRQQPTDSPTENNNNHGQDNHRGSSTRRRDNHGGDRGDQVSPSSQHPLPDIIQCHGGISLDLTFETTSRVPRTSSTAASTTTTTSADCPGSNNVLNESNDTTEGVSELGEDWSLELKLVGPWRQAGIELRAIADQFQLENGRRSPRGRRRSFKCRLFNVNIAFPAAALLGLGLAWLRH